MTENPSLAIQASTTTVGSPPVTSGPHSAAREWKFYALATMTFVASVAATIYFYRSMSGGMPMPGDWTMSMMWMRMPGQTWPAATAMFLLMWLAMMVAMMLPSAMPMLLRYRRALLAHGQSRVALPTIILAAGYFFVWFGIGALVYVPGVVFALATMRSAGISHAVPVLTGAALAISGCFQFTSWKMCGLRQCRGSQHCPAPLVHGTPQAAWRHGLSQGAACAICCTGPMLTLLVLGAMNLTVMAIIAALIALEKLMPKPEWIVQLSGLAALSAGLFMILRPLLH